ncbi:hypothetical protein QL285_025377 [Trifolium repens]|nr:hypothetical protein QL285_025377 [Trifolium repens]
MASFNIPWKCLESSSVSQKTFPIPPKPPKSFAQALTNVCDIPLSQFPQPVVKGDRLAIEIPEIAYEAGLQACKHNLHGRILWPKGSTPLSVVSLKTKLSSVWKDFSTWGVISLGKGYFEFTFSTLEDVRRVRSVPSWNLNPGMLKLFAWTKDFNPRMQRNTSAQIWVRFYGLSQEYWHKSILFAIASSIGTPICTDSITAKPMHERTFGQFARILVDMDLSLPTRYKVLVERKGYAFFVDLEYENMPDFCTGCQNIGHSVETCRKMNNEEHLKIDKDIVPKKKLIVEQKKTYIPVKDKNELGGSVREIIQIDDGSKQQQQVVEQSNSSEVHSSHRPGKEVMIDNTLEENPVQINPVQHANSLTGNLNTSTDNPVQINQVQQVQQLECNNAAISGQQAVDNGYLGPVLSPMPQASQVQQPDNNNDGNSESFDSDSSETFVNATQIPIFQNGPSHMVQNPFPERVLADMEFLKKSWANMVEEDEVNQDVNNDVSHAVEDEQQVQQDGFTIHLSKQQKKNQRKKVVSSRDSYATRSKVSPKPFR